MDVSFSSISSPQSEAGEVRDEQLTELIIAPEDAYQFPPVSQDDQDFFCQVSSNPSDTAAHLGDR